MTPIYKATSAALHSEGCDCPRCETPANYLLIPEARDIDGNNMDNEKTQKIQGLRQAREDRVLAALEKHQAPILMMADTTIPFLRDAMTSLLQ